MQSLQEQDLALLNSLEDYFCEPEVTGAISAFLQTTSREKFVFVEDGQEQPHSNFVFFKEYAALISEVLDKMCAALRVEVSEVAAHLASLLDASPMALRSFTCVDYIVATLQFDRFCELMYDQAAMEDYEAGSDSEVEGEASVQ